MRYSNQILKTIHFEKLKNLNDLDISFKEVGLTGILGPNGSGKSTILHALCCLYQPNQNDSSINYRFSDFFTPTIHSPWSGSKLIVKHDYRIAANEFLNQETEYTKNTDRWAPKYDRRPKRYVTFIGIKTTAPAIELENQKSRIVFNTELLSDVQSIRVRQYAGNVMNRSYTEFNLHKTAKSKEYIGVLYDGINYSSLNMGAGEQRIFYVLGEVLKCPNHGLVIIDEIDLLLHKRALKKLLIILNELAVQKNLQIIFTTHNHSILKLDFISYRHLYQTPIKTLCFEDTKPQALYRLTGEQEKPLEIFVEDKLARFLINTLCKSKGIGHYLKVNEFGPAFNCFTCASSAVLNNSSNLGNMLFVLDGDRYRTDAEKQEQINKVLTGNLNNHVLMRQDALSKISQFVLPIDVSPEEHIKNCILQLDYNELDANEKVIYDALVDIVNPLDRHSLIDAVVERLGEEIDVNLNEIVKLFAKSSEWDNVMDNLNTWFDSKAIELIEN